MGGGRQTRRGSPSRWLTACGGPALGSAILCLALAVSIPRSLDEVLDLEPREGALPVLSPTPATRSVSAPQPSPAGVRQRPPSAVGRQRGVSAPVVPAAIIDPTEIAWIEEEQERLKELEWQQKNSFKRMLDMKNAYNGIDTTLLTVEEITGRSLRGREKYLARQAALAEGRGGAAAWEEEDGDGEDPDWEIDLGVSPEELKGDAAVSEGGSPSVLAE